MLRAPAAFAQRDYLASLGDVSDYPNFPTSDEPGQEEPEYVPSYLKGGAGGWSNTDQPAQHSPADKVASYMHKLRALGYDAPESGNAYDPDVRQAVAEFQRDKGLSPDDGLVGPQFYAAVDRAVRVSPSPSSPPSSPPASPSAPLIPNILPAGLTENKPPVLLIAGGVAAGLVVLALVFGKKKGRGKRRR